jgi:signal transduction histidine kinase/tetratricopeptide (TPR) repeat protein
VSSFAALNKLELIASFFSFKIKMKKKEKEKPLRKRMRVVQKKKASSKMSVSVKQRLAEDELERSREELRNLTRHLQSVREEERTHIAREMHDELGQKLTGLKMDLAGLKKKLPKKDQGIIKKLSDMLDLTDSSIQTVKRISTELRPRVLDDLGLGSAMEWQAGEFQNRTGIKCIVKSDPENIELDKELSTSLFRIFQESLTNVARYAEASKVEVKLIQMGGTLELSIQDNGKGIGEEEGAKAKSFGLLGMRERVRYLGGEFTIVGDPTCSPHSEAGLTGRQAWRKGKKKKGTTITVRVPMQEAMGRPLQTATKMVGREKELRRIRVLLESVHRRTRIGLPKMIFIKGEAGIGKSRMMRELQQNVVSRGETVLIGNCYEETHSIPYFPFRDALKRFFEINKEEAISTFKKLPGYSQWEISRILPVGAYSDILLPKFEQTSNKYRLYEAIRLFLENISGRFGLFIIEDLHWSDAASLDLLHYLTRNVTQIGMIGTFRTEETVGVSLHRFISSLQKENLTEEIKLQPLPRDELSALLNQLTSGLKQSKQFQDDLYKKTQGNPFFVEELLIFYGRSNLPIGQAGVSLDKMEVPKTIQAVLQKRIGSLSTETKEVLTCGALIGEEFDFEVLRKVLKKSEEDILDAVEGGIREHFVRELVGHESGPERYKFNHSLMSDVLYFGIGKVKRRILHGKVGEALEAVYADRLEVLNGHLSFHFEKGEKWEKAFDYAFKSAKHAKDVYANQESIRMYEKAREILPRITVESESDPKEAEIDISQGLGDVYRITGEYEKALQEYRMIDKLARIIGDEEIKGGALSKIAGIYSAQGKLNESILYGKRSYKIHQKTGNRKGLAVSLNDIGIVHMMRGDYGEALKCYKDSLVIRREFGDKELIAGILNNIGNVYLDQGDSDKALKCLEESLSIKREFGNKRGISVSLNNIGNVHHGRGDNMKSLKCLQEALKISREIGEKFGTALNMFNISLVHLSLGAHMKALKYYEESLTIFREIGDKSYVERSLNGIGVIHWKLGRYKEALKIFEEALAILKQIGSKKALASIFNNIGVIHFNLGDYGKALNYLDESYTIQKKIESKMGTAWSLLDLGTLHQLLFDLEHAMQFHKESITLMEEIKAKNEMVKVLTEIGTNYFLLGENEESLKYSKKALGIVVKLGIGDEPCVLEILSKVCLSKYKELSAKRKRKSEDFLKKAGEYCERLLRIAEKEGLKGDLAKGKKIRGEILLEQVVSHQLSVVRQKKTKISAISVSQRLKLKEAEKELKEALRIAEEIEAKPLLWQIHASLGNVYSTSDKKGSKKIASEQFTKSKGIIQKIASTIGDEKLKKTFLNAKPIQSVLKISR